MAGIVTFLLTAVYAQSALLRLREYYNNKGKLLPEQVIIEPAPIWCIFMGLSSNFWCSIRKKGCVTLSQDCLTSLAGEYLKLQKVVLRFLLRFTNFCWLSLRVCHQKYSPFHKICGETFFTGLETQKFVLKGFNHGNPILVALSQAGSTACGSTSDGSTGWLGKYWQRMLVS